MKVAYSAPEAEGELEAIELLWGLLAEAPMDVEAQDELAIRYLRRLQPQALSVLAIFTAASVLLMLPPSPAATCALVGAVLLPWRFLADAGGRSGSSRAAATTRSCEPPAACARAGR